MDKSAQGWVAHGGLTGLKMGHSLGHGLTIVWSIFWWLLLSLCSIVSVLLSYHWRGGEHGGVARQSVGWTSGWHQSVEWSSIFLSLIGAWGGAKVSLEMNFGPCEECVRSEKLRKWLEGMSLEMNLRVWGPNFTVNAMVFRLTKFYMHNQTHGKI